MITNATIICVARDTEHRILNTFPDKEKLQIYLPIFVREKKVGRQLLGTRLKTLLNRIFSLIDTFFLNKSYQLGNEYCIFRSYLLIILVINLVKNRKFGQKYSSKSIKQVAIFSRNCVKKKSKI